MVKEVIKNLDSSKASGPGCVPVVVLKNCEPELSYILTKLFSMCLEGLISGQRSTAKNYHPVSLVSVVSKVFEKLVIKRIVDHLENCGLFSDFQYGLRSCQSTEDLLTVVSGRIARTFKGSGATRAVPLDIS